MKTKYPIHDADSLQTAIKQLRQDHELQKQNINAQLSHLQENKWSVIWASFNPFKNNTEGPNILNKAQDYLVPFMLGMRSMSSSPITKVVLKIAELFIAKYIVKESGGWIDSIVEKYQKRKKKDTE
ncbi:MAG: hypothetical protein EBZ58_09265 [Bacteroidetes bacterium]|nr:hypothetical protein [Bacteroidota bacterium]